MRNYYDSECVKRAKTSKILAIDASYKVPKWMMKWGKDRMYDALHSGTNEYNEIVMQRFSTSDNHDELGSNLDALGFLGLSPHLAFSDDPGRDESLLKRCFPKLKNKADEIVEIDDGDIDPSMIEFQSTKLIIYVHTFDDVCAALSQFRKDIENAIKATEVVKIAFDTE